MIELYHQILVRPIFNFLVFLYNTIPGGDFGIAILVLTIIIRFIFTPLSIKTLVSQKKLNMLQPKIKELQDKHKNDRVALGQATMAMYKEHGVNPFSGCLPLLIQLPILLALYSALGSGFKQESLTTLYGFVSNPGSINEISLGFLNLAHKAPLLGFLAGGLQWLQSKLSLSYQSKNGAQDKGNPAIQMTKQMLYFFPVMVIIIAWNLPAGLVLYWVVTTLFSVFEQMYINKRFSTVG